MTAFALEDLERLIIMRAESGEAGSYTCQLVQAGAQRCAKKLGEEGVETALAIASGNAANVRAEAADLLYHLLVGLYISGVTLSDVCTELQHRTAQTGLEEKAARKNPT